MRLAAVLRVSERDINLIVRFEPMWLSPELAGMNKLVAEPRIFLGVESIDGPIDHAPHAR